MDCEMPEMDGWEATQQIRLSKCVRENGQPTQICALSAHAMEHFVEKARASGMDGYLPKPITLGKLTELLVSLQEKTEEYSQISSPIRGEIGL
jgi:CheY-like chemotaxis protein